MRNQIEVKIIEDSIVKGSRLTTMQMRYPRMIHSEYMTHRVFSRNASSSRAVPAKKMWKQIMEAPAMPSEWGLNEPGMQATKNASPEVAAEAEKIWMEAANSAVEFSKRLDALGLHKQIVNRVTEPFSFIQVVMTSSYWDNFFGLRCHPDADPTMQELAYAMKNAFDASIPKEMVGNMWHLPYVTAEDDKYTIEEKTKFSVARSARVSYILHDGTATNPEKDLELYNRLGGGIPPHMSPFEHQARPARKFGDFGLQGNLSPEWVQFRKCVENNMEDRFIKELVL